jgi:hypothetical protein
VLGTRDSSRSLPTWRAHRACFDAAIGLWPTPTAKVEVPYEGTTLKGYWLSPDPGTSRRPVAILNNGSDGSAVDMLVMGAVAAIERGWHALIFDGPGQGAALYEDGLPFRFDWEKVVTPVVDFALPPRRRPRRPRAPRRQPSRLLSAARLRLRASPRRRRRRSRDDAGGD